MVNHDHLALLVHRGAVYSLQCCFSHRWLTRHKNLWRRLFGLAAVFHVVINIALTCLLLYVSQLNYPGGVAIRTLHDMESKSLGIFMMSLHTWNIYWYVNVYLLSFVFLTKQFACQKQVFLSSKRQRLSYDVSPEVKRSVELVYAVLFMTVTCAQWCAHYTLIWAVLSFACSSDLDVVFCVFVTFIYVQHFMCFDLLPYSFLLLYWLVSLCLVFSTKPRDWLTRNLQYGLFYVDWDIKP